MNASVMNGIFKGCIGVDKEEQHMNMIKTERYKNYGLIEEQADGTVDVETSVFHVGTMVPASQVKNSTTPVIRTAYEPKYGQLEEQANGTANVETFVFNRGNIEPANQTENSTTPIIKTAPEPNYGQLEDQANGTADVEAYVFRNGEIVPANQAQNSSTPVINTSREKNYGQLDDVTSARADIGDTYLKSDYSAGGVIQELSLPSLPDNVDTDASTEQFVFRDSVVVPIKEMAEQDKDGAIIHTAPGPAPYPFWRDRNYITNDLYLFYHFENELDKELLVYRNGITEPVGKVVLFDSNTETDE